MQAAADRIEQSRQEVAEAVSNMEQKELEVRRLQERLKSKAAEFGSARQREAELKDRIIDLKAFVEVNVATRER